jgi:photosystem II stability/assembly factor-like uncharacterized protein
MKNYVLIIVLFLFSFIQTQAQWEMVISVDDDKSISDMFVLDENVVFVIGSHGLPNIYSYVMKSVDGGISWIDYQEFTDQYFKSVYFTSQDTGYIATNYLGGLVAILRTTDAGVNWEEISPQYPFGNVQRLPLFFYGNSGIGIMTTEGVTYKSVDSGFSWTEIDNFGIGGFFADLNEGRFATIAGSLYALSFDTCETWEGGFYSNSASARSVDINANKIFIGANGTNGNVLGYPNFQYGILSIADINNQLFQTIHFPSFSWVYEICIYNESLIYASGGSVFIKSIDGGVSWFSQTHTPSNTGAIVKIECVSSELCYAQVAPDKIFKTTNGGGELQEQVLTVGGEVGFNEEKFSNTITISPNPSTHTVYLSSPDITPGSFVRIYNLSGQLVYEQNVLEQNERLAITTTDIGLPGMYVVQLHAPNKAMAVQKLVVAE